MATITVIIQRDGSTQTAVKGAKGASCRSLTSKLEADFGNVIDREVTSEAYATAEVQQLVAQEQL